MKSCCIIRIFLYPPQPLPQSTYVEFAVAATDCAAKDVTDPAKCNLLAEKVSRPGRGDGKTGHRTECPYSKLVSWGFRGERTVKNTTPRGAGLCQTFLCGVTSALKSCHQVISPLETLGVRRKTEAIS